MEDKDLQLENGNYTRIVNKVIDELVKAPLLGAELAICFFILRKTYGYNKKEDEISLSQFQSGINRSRPTITKALKNLQLVNILKLVKPGNTKGACNIWLFNKYYKTWNLVKIPQLVKDRTKPSKEKIKNLVKIPLHTKDNNKRQTKDNSKKETFLQGKQWNELIDSFKEINPVYEDFYKNTTERKALDTLAKKITYEKLLATIKKLPETNSIPYFPKITSPSQLKRDLGKLIASYNQEKAKKDIKSIAEGNKKQSFAGIAQEIML